jgi:hypothetical protein
MLELGGHYKISLRTATDNSSFIGEIILLGQNNVHVILFEPCLPIGDVDHPNLIGFPFVRINHNLFEVLDTDKYKFEDTFIVNKCYAISLDLMFRKGRQNIFGIDSKILKNESQSEMIESYEFPFSSLHVSFGKNGDNLDLECLLTSKHFSIGDDQPQNT